MARKNKYQIIKRFDLFSLVVVPKTLLFVRLPIVFGMYFPTFKYSKDRGKSKIVYNVIKVIQGSFIEKKTPRGEVFRSLDLWCVYICPPLHSQGEILRHLNSSFRILQKRGSSKRD